MTDEPYNPSPIGNPSVLARRNWWQTALVKFIGKHTPKCRDMVRILSQAMDEPMPLSMRIQKRLHFLICCWCQRYEEQLHYMRKTAREFPGHADAASNVPVPGETRARWKEALRAAPDVARPHSEAVRTAEVIRRRSAGAGVSTRPSRWLWTSALAAAAVFLIAFLFTVGRPAPSASLADFRDEMVAFAKIDPSLEMKSTQLSHLTKWLEASYGMSDVAIPENVKAMEPVGCRVLRFRGHDVGLICFRRANGTLLHLFVINRAAFPRLPGRNRPEFTSHGEWMTAAWVDSEHAYLMALQGDQPTLENFLKL